MPVITFPLPVPQFIQRKLDNGRAKLDACTPLVLLRRRLAEADTVGCSSPSSDDRLSLPMLLERHGRWSTALMCGAVEEVAMGLLVYQNGPVPVCEGSLPKARIAAQKVALAACNLLLSKSTELVDRGVDAVQCVKETSLVLRKISPAPMPCSLPGIAVLRSLDGAFSDKTKAKAAVRAFLNSHVNARVLGAHACFFDAAEDLVRWHKLLRVHQPEDPDQYQLQLRSALHAVPARAKLAMQRAWTAASVWALCGALSHASAANMVLTIIMASDSDDCMDEEEPVVVEQDQVKDEGVPALEPEVQKRAKQDADDKPAVPARGSEPAAGGSKLKQEDENSEDEGARLDEEAIKHALKRRGRPVSFITSQGNKYRLKTQTGGTQQDDPSSRRHRVIVKASLQSKGKSKGSKAKEAVLGIRVRVPAERLREGARVVADDEDEEDKFGQGGQIEDKPSVNLDGPGVEVNKAPVLAIPKETEFPAIQSIKDPNVEPLEKLPFTRNNAEVTPAAKYGTISGSDKKKSLRRGAAEAVGRLSLRLMSKAATILPDAVVAAGSAVIVRGSSALGLDDTLALQTYYTWEEGPAVIGPWGSQGRWTLVADNCPPPSPPTPKPDASAYASGEETSSSGGLESSNAVNTGENASPSEGGAVEHWEKTSHGVKVVPAERVKKPIVVGSENIADSTPETSVESPVKVEALCSDADASKEAESKKKTEPTSKSKPMSPFRPPLDYYPRPRLSWFALQAGLQSVRDVIKSIRGRSGDLWQDGAAAGETKGSGGREKGTHLLEIHDQEKSEKSESVPPANGAQEGDESSIGEKDCALSSTANLKWAKAAQGAVDDDGDGDGNITHESTSDKQAVEEELLEGEKEESASDHENAGEEFKQDTRRHDNITIMLSPCVPGSWVGTVNRRDGPDPAEVGEGSEMSRNFSNSSDATLVNTGTGGDSKGKTIDRGDNSDGALMSWMCSTRIVDLGDSIVGMTKALNAQAKETRRHVSEDDADLTMPMISEDGYMAESESFDDFVDDEKSAGLADSDSFGEFVEGGT